MSDRLEEIERRFTWSMTKVTNSDTQWLIAEVKRLRGPAPGGGRPPQEEPPQKVWLWRIGRDEGPDETWTDEPNVYDPECLVGEYVLGVARPGEDAPPLGDFANLPAVQKAKYELATWIAGKAGVFWYGIECAELLSRLDALLALRGTPPSSPPDANLIFAALSAAEQKRTSWENVQDVYAAIRRIRGGPTPSREQPPK